MRWGAIGLIGCFVVELSHWLIGWPEHVIRAELWIVVPAASLTIANYMDIVHEKVNAPLTEFRARYARIDERLKRIEEQINSKEIV